MISSLARSVKSRCRYCGPASNLPVWPLGQSDRRRDRVGSVEVTVAALSATDSAQAQARLSEGSDTTGRGPGPGPWAQSGPGELPRRRRPLARRRTVGPFQRPVTQDMPAAQASTSAGQRPVSVDMLDPR